MLFKKDFFALFVFFVSGSLFAQSSSGENLEIRVQEALQVMDALIGETTGQNTTPVQPIRGGQQPRWVNDPYSAYSREQYIAAVGYATNRSEAEKSAFASLVAVFGQSIQSSFEIAAVYSEAISNDIVVISENTNVRDAIVTAASLDTLVGAEIGAVWEDRRGTVYALAYMNRRKTVDIYTAMIRVNLLNIENLLAMNIDEKNTFNGVARYKLAALISGINEKYANVIAQAGGNPADSLNLTSADAFNIEASRIIGNISVVVRVDNDRGNRIRDVFAGVLTGEGLRTRGSNPPYTLEVIVDINQMAVPGSDYAWCNYTISSQLVENATDSVLLPFNYSGREGHRTYEMAVNRAVLEMERKINEQYPVMLREYLAAQVPQR